jgi:hypothetical protein
LKEEKKNISKASFKIGSYEQSLCVQLRIEKLAGDVSDDEGGLHHFRGESFECHVLRDPVFGIDRSGPRFKRFLLIYSLPVSKLAFEMFFSFSSTTCPVQWHRSDT